MTSVVSPTGDLLIQGDAADTIAISTLNGLVLVNGADPDSGSRLADGITSIEIDGSSDANLVDFGQFHIEDFPNLATIQVDGGGGQDTLAGPDVGLSWFLLSDDSGDLLWPDSGPTFSFVSIGNLSGGADDDSFIISDGAHLSGVLDGGGGHDTLDAEDVTTPLTATLSGSDADGFAGRIDFLGDGFQGIDQLVGGVDYNLLKGLSVDSRWTLNADPTYSDGNQTLGFSGFGLLQGGSAADTFDLFGDGTGIVTAKIGGGAGDDLIRFHGNALLVGEFDGQTGTDTLSYSPFGTSAAVTLVGSSEVGYAGFEPASFDGNGFSGIDAIVGAAPSVGPSTLVGEDIQSTWTLGDTQVYDDGSGRKLGLTGFAILQGGAAADRFQVRSDTEASLAGGAGNDIVSIAPGAQLTGSIDGQDGRNAIDFAAFSTPVRVDLSDGTATRVGAGVTNIQLVTGGSGDDTLIGGGGDELDGGPGNDAFFLSRGTGNLLTITDPSGDDTLDFSAFSSGVSIELDPTGVRPIGDGLYLLLVGAFEHFNGSRFPDTLNVVERPGVRSVLGSLPAQKPGDRLIFDASGNVVDTSTPGLFIIGDAVLRYDEFETVSIINQAPVPTQAALAIDIRPSAGSVAVGQSLSFVLTVFNGGPGPATGVIVTDTLSGDVAVLSARSDRGTARVSGNQLVFDLGSIASGASATAVVTVNPLSAGTVTNSATVRGVEPNPDPADARASVTVAVVPLPDPIPPAIESLWRYGIHLHPTHLVLTFNETLSVTGAQDPHNYRLAGPGKDGRFGTADDLVIRLRPILYDPSRRDVILIPSRRLPLHHRFQLTVSGITNPAGLPLDGISGGSRVIRFQGRGIVYPETIPESRALLHGPRKSIRPRPHPISRHLHPARDLARR